MHKKIVYFVTLITFLVTLSGCNNKSYEENNNSTNSESTETPEVKPDPIKEQISKMTIDEKIGQMIIVGLDGYSMDDNAKKMIENYHVGGFILFSKNVKDSAQVVSLTNSLKQTNSANKIPLFVSVDEEGGRVSRMPSSFKKLPTNKVIGTKNNSELSYKVGELLGDEVKSLGYNVDFAPVLDINSNPKNPVIGDRSFGSTPEIVTKLGIQTMKGIQSKNVIPAVKHFPGHGDTSVDSHKGLPTVNNDLNRLNSFELIPFQEAIKESTDMIMVAHILLPKIDAKYPASMSKTIITDTLRGQLKYDGVVITDDMTMGAISKGYKIEDAVVTSVNAGSDIVLVCYENNTQIAAINSLKKAVETGVIKTETIDKSVYRILKLKNKYNLQDTSINNPDVTKINNSIDSVLKTYNK
ncbi:beta-N-acetylhexosaminidase [Clostridium sp. SHJSY1]|uniref:beta-N-acetylhexosaminidase n=1 Tax=Clostridium sp. SHJSY1 TaxID=2942483 RepID=UPI0028759CE7|nr:beta-N-acetylhexosaminidase [Clostridium sp. SHJSY1]MDS0525797.1 beta-N-acetylhexosaminidase [Clostridium sp. SHJSY1]